MAAVDTDRLFDLVSREYRVLVELCHLGSRQQQALEQREMSRLLDLLDAKQRLFATLDEIGRELAPFRRVPPSEDAWRSPQDLAAYRQLVLRCEALLAESSAQESHCMEQLSRFRDEIAVRLDHAHVAGQAAHAYGSPQPRVSGQLDLSSDR